MDVLHTGHWIGKSISYIPRDTLSSIERYFKVIESGHDVSVLSEPDIDFCFFYFDKNQNNPLLLTSVKICQNLNKSLIIIHNGSVDEEILSLDIVVNSFDVDKGDISDWVEQLSKNIHYNFTSHQEVIDIHKNEPQLSNQNISKNLLEILRYIELNLSKTIKEEDIAEYCHYSVTYFSKVFHNSVGMSFRDYLTTKRITLAKQLLIDDRKSKIAFIAYQCGYKDVSYFSRIFKKKTGVSPGLFRQIH
ncbi:helix-turn-helix domain-containing protein [Vibrio marisflavi]|uniref:HTH-type transcriptional activator RhaR n=1 Tax=Vibrio marisflavi CECT 7928 TaxID=634439 RepID=A0ABM9A7C1_9VIBR|nr:AraC family transcriptional regulator [Vibrio marisflavi]CAH0541214.1 HTH-type transcriptional activator RhaR [Vibrio marisflavi CECT 7928]